MATLTLIVAVCQARVVDGDVEGNLRRVEELVRQASDAGAQIACFPETALIGWVNTQAYQLAQPVPGALSDRVAAIARKHRMPVAIGITERVDGGLYDCAILVGADGQILHKHRKVNTLVELLTPPYLRGRSDDIQAVDTPLGRIGVMICADCFIEDHRQRMARLGPDWIWIPYGWAADKAWPDHGKKLQQVVSQTARVARAPVVGPNLVGQITTGPWKGKTYAGLSAVADAAGKIIAVGEHDRQQMFTVTIQRRPK